MLFKKIFILFVLFLLFSFSSYASMIETEPYIFSNNVTVASNLTVSGTANFPAVSYLGSYIAGPALTTNTTITFDSTMSAATINAIILGLPRHLNNLTLTLHFNAGTYTLNNVISCNYFLGGLLKIEGATTTAGPHTNQTSILDFSTAPYSYSSDLMAFYNSNVSVNNLLVKSNTTNQNGGISCCYDEYSIIKNCFVSGNTNTATTAYYVIGGRGHIQNCTVNNCIYNVQVTDGGIVVIDNCTWTNIAPYYGVIANDSVVLRKDTIIIGGTSENGTYTGGLIITNTAGKIF